MDILFFFLSRKLKDHKVKVVLEPWVGISHWV